MPDLHLWQWLLALFCALMVGIAKTGVPGLGILVVPLMVYVVGDAKLSAGALLPMLCVADAFAVVYYRRHANWRKIFELSPWVAIGLAVGVVVLDKVSSQVLTTIIAAIILVMIGVHIVRKRVTDTAVPHGWITALLFGSIAGFATMVSNAAGPVMNLYLLSMALPKDQFMGTGAWYFFIINLVKVPIFVAQGSITGETLVFDALMIPAIVVGALSGRQLYSRVPQKIFEVVVLTLACAAALWLLRPQQDEPRS
jgi:uncharacterized protein